MIDVDAVKKTILSKLKHAILGKSQYGNQEWQKTNDEWYASMHDSNYLLHENFIKYFKEKNNLNTVLEVVCGTGIHPIKHRELFEGKMYTGIDISQDNVDDCKKTQILNLFAEIS